MSGDQTVLGFTDACLQAMQHYEQNFENMVQNSERNAAVQKYAYLVLIAFSLRRHLEMCIGYYNKGYSQKFCDEALHLMAERLNSCRHHMFQNQWKEVTTEEIWQMCDSSNRNRLKMLLTGMGTVSNKLHNTKND